MTVVDVKKAITGKVCAINVMSQADSEALTLGVDNLQAVIYQPPGYRWFKAIAIFTEEMGKSGVPI